MENVSDKDMSRGQWGAFLPKVKLCFTPTQGAAEDPVHLSKEPVPEGSQEDVFTKLTKHLETVSSHSEVDTSSLLKVTVLLTELSASLLFALPTSLRLSRSSTEHSNALDL